MTPGSSEIPLLEKSPWLGIEDCFRLVKLEPSHSSECFIAPGKGP